MRRPREISRNGLVSLLRWFGQPRCLEVFMGFWLLVLLVFEGFLMVFGWWFHLPSSFAFWGVKEMALLFHGSIRRYCPRVLKQI